MMLFRLIQKKYQPTYKAMCWLMTQELIFAICGLVDITCANFVSNDAVIGITMAILISDFALNLRYVFGSSLRVTTARYYGADNKSAVGGTLTAITILSFVLTVIIVCVLGFFGRNLLELFALTPNQTDLADAYIKARIPWIIAEPLMRTCFVFKDVKVIMITKIAGIALLQIPAQIIALKLGADVFCMPICYIATDFLWFVVTYRRYRKLPIYHKNEKYNTVPQISGV